MKKTTKIYKEKGTKIPAKDIKVFLETIEKAKLHNNITLFASVRVSDKEVENTIYHHNVGLAGIKYLINKVLFNYKLIPPEFLGALKKDDKEN